jgi:hypothetical protein
VTVLPLGTGLCMTGPLLSKKITYKTFFTFRNLLAIPAHFAFSDAQILLELLRFGFPKQKGVHSQITLFYPTFTVFF